MKTKSILIVLLCVFALSCAKAETDISGEIFIATKGGQNFKLGAVPVYVFKKSSIDGYREVKSSAFNFLSSAADKTISDSDGRFSIKLPAGEYFLAVEAERDVFGKTESYQWLIPVSANREKVTVSLNNQNMEP